MNSMTENRLQSEVNEFFDELSPDARPGIEAMYQAFKNRMILELRITGGSNSGVIYGHLEDVKR
jgi:hypothetical protein